MKVRMLSSFLLGFYMLPRRLSELPDAVVCIMQLCLLVPVTGRFLPTDVCTVSSQKFG